MNKSSYLLITIGLIVVGITIFLMNSAPDKKQNISNENTNTSTQNTNKDINTISTIEVTFLYKKATPPTPQIISVQQDQNVIFKITTDVEDEAHLHGYDISKSLIPNQENLLEFTATETGRFELELENLGTLLGIVEVHPK